VLGGTRYQDPYYFILRKQAEAKTKIKNYSLGFFLSIVLEY